MLKELLTLYNGTTEIAPIANGAKAQTLEMLDCNCVDSDCAISD